MAVECPSVVTTYNKFMGGVDLLDGLIALYRTKIRSKKWYLRLVFHFFDLLVVVSWLLYRRDCDQLNVPVKERLRLLDFKADIAQCLCSENKSTPKRKGRPSANSIASQLEQKKHRGPANPLPPDADRLDGVGHWVTFAEKRGRCKLPNCTGIIKTQCSKCCENGANIYLCVTEKKNCFVEFHTK